MAKREAHYTDYLPEILEVASREGVLLVVEGADGRPNAMTIGWCTVGVIWGKPILTALVRPSRHTYGLLEKAGDFTVNVMPADMKEAVNFCGTKSGRGHDKFAEMKMTAAPSRAVASPIIAEGVIHYECRVLYKNDLPDDVLEGPIRDAFYPQGDYHRIYYAEIVAAYADEDVRERISGP
ncbi:MAG: flavin reductase family protein [Armatimonadetes bacterium]|nr:flavin reductase family protein [Armatimonadota bacterium]